MDILDIFCLNSVICGKYTDICKKKIEEKG